VAERWHYIQPRLSFTASGLKVTPTRVELRFALNTVPTATISLPLGQALPGEGPAETHRILRLTENLMPVRLSGSFISQRSDADLSSLGLPEEETTLFDGYVVPMSYSRGAAQVTAQLHCEHVLGYMNQTSSLSDSSHTSNPAAYTLAASFTGSGSTGTAHWTALTQALDHITPTAIAQDLWGNALLPWFQALLEVDPLWIRERGFRPEQHDPRTRIALERLQPGVFGAPPVIPRSLLTSGLDVASAISQDLHRLKDKGNPEALSQRTLWDLLAFTAGSYMMGIVPMSRGGAVVPFIAGYTGNDVGKVYKEITPDQIYKVDDAGTSTRRLRAVAILTAGVELTGATARPPGSSQLGVGGWYEGGLGQGTVLIERAPAWLAMTALKRNLLHRLDDVFGHFLGIIQQHHGLVLEKQRVVDPGIARTHRAFHEEDRLGFFNIEHRHAVNRRGRIVLGRRVGDIIGANHIGDIGLGEFAVDVFHLEHFIVRHVGFGQQDIHMTGHAPRHRVDGVFDLDPFTFEQIGHFPESVLCLRYRHAVAGHDDDFRGIFHDISGIFGGADFGLAVTRIFGGCGLLSAKAAEYDRDKGTVHALAHDVG